MVEVSPHTGVHPLSAGDFFRELWGPRAGWAQAVSIPLPGTLAPTPTMPTPLCPRSRSCSVPTSARARSQLAASIRPARAEAGTALWVGPSRDTPGTVT